MNNQEIHELIFQRYTAAQSALGRCLLNVHSLWKGLVWRWFMAGTQTSKRVFDIVGSLAFIIVFGPLMLIIFLLVKLEDGGPVLFTQTRVGKFGREFKMLKFR